MITAFTDAEDIAWEKTLPAKVMSGCLAIRHNGTVLMVKANYKDHWCFPSGIIDAEESPFTAALRETYEETGLRIPADKCTPLGIVYKAAKGGHKDRLNFAFATEVETTDLAFNIPNDEIDEVAWVPFEEVATWANNRQSYQVFQKLLTESAPAFYVENL